MARPCEGRAISPSLHCAGFFIPDHQNREIAEAAGDRERAATREPVGGISQVAIDGAESRRRSPPASA